VAASLDNNSLEKAMKVYLHPVSTTSRPIRLLIAENKIDVQEQVVDILTGEHYQEPFTAINPNRMVPVLEDGDFRLTESSAILKYLGDKFNLPCYPKDLRQRAKVNEMMDWFNTNFSRDFGYGLVYPQIFPHHKRRSAEAQEATLEWGKERAKGWLSVLDSHFIGPKNQYLCGDQITIADYVGIALVTLGDIIRCDYSAYPNLQRWIANMKRLPSWGKINEMFYGFAGSVKDQQFNAI
jgi:glutathione S-transferase